MNNLINFSNQLQALIHENRILVEENRYLKSENEELNKFVENFNKNTHKTIEELLLVPFNNMKKYQ